VAVTGAFDTRPSGEKVSFDGRRDGLPGTDSGYGCLDTDLAPHDLPAYSRLLLDICDGDATLSIRGDEAEEAWRIMDPVLAAWAAGATPLREYAAGSLGHQRCLEGPLRDTDHASRELLLDGVKVDDGELGERQGSGGRSS
jgi:hypothetical protein